MTEKTKITVVGSGYVGMSLSILLAQHNEVTVLDIDAEKVNKINSNQSTIADREIESFLKTKMLNLTATLDKQTAYKDASFIIGRNEDPKKLGTIRFCKYFITRSKES